MPHIRSGGLVYRVTEQELERVRRVASSAAYTDLYEEIEINEIINGWTFKSVLLYTKGVPISFHYWDI